MNTKFGRLSGKRLPKFHVMKAELFGLITCIVLAGNTTAWAGTCTTSTFDTYFASGFSCTVGDLEFSNFTSYADTVTGGAGAVTPSSITVTPGGSDATSLDLTLTFTALSASSNQTSTVTFDYVVTPLNGFALPGANTYNWTETYSGTGTTIINSLYTIPGGFPTTASLQDFASIEASGGTAGGVTTNTYEDAWYVAATPIPAALPLFASGLGALGLLGWRRKRKAQAAA
jgi:hypothetical protein